MGDLIDRDALITELWFKCREQREMNEFSKGISYGFRAAITTTKRLPTVEAEPVAHGEWIGKGFAYKCSVCGKREPESTKEYADKYWNYCPN